jgi:hypothetical protein
MNQPQLLVSIFFIYLGSASGAINSMLSCQLQKFMAQSVIFRHFSLLLTIFIFTFIVGWYTPESIVSAKEEEKKILEGMRSQAVATRPIAPSTGSIKKKTTGDGHKVLLLYALYTLGIYLAILLTTHCELPYLLAFLSLLVVLFFKYLYDLFDYPGDPDVEAGKWKAGILEYIAIAILLVGVGVYTMRQYKDHSSNWNTLTFIFGKPTCGK